MERTEMATRRFGFRVRRLATLALLLAAVGLGLFGQVGIGRAEPITTSSDGWTRENFASSCKAAGGRVVEIDSPGIKYSKCYFPNGGVNKCDWIKKTCTFGFVVRDPGVRADVPANVVVATDGGTGGGKAGGVKGTVRADALATPEAKQG